jgi:hypothetical protein
MPQQDTPVTMASPKGDPARDPKPFVNPYKNLDLPPEAFTFGNPVSLTVFVSICPLPSCQLPDGHFHTIMVLNGFFHCLFVT